MVHVTNMSLNCACISCSCYQLKKEGSLEKRWLPCKGTVFWTWGVLRFHIVTGCTKIDQDCMLQKNDKGVCIYYLDLRGPASDPHCVHRISPGKPLAFIVTYLTGLLETELEIFIQFSGMTLWIHIFSPWLRKNILFSVCFINSSKSVSDVSHALDEGE